MDRPLDDMTNDAQTVYQAPDPSDQIVGDPVELVENNHRLIQFPDGSGCIEDLSKVKKEPGPQGYDQNLVEILPDDVVARIGFELKNAIEDDIDSQSAYFEGIANVIRLMGINIGDGGKDNLPFEGASSIYSTAMFESILDQVADAISSLLPSHGIVDCKINGQISDENTDIAYRKKALFNYYFTSVAKEFKKEMKRTLLWAILTGSCYKKVYICPTLGRPTSQFISPEDFIVNREFSTHLTATRKTHILYLSERDLKIRQMNGLYADIPLSEDDGHGHDNSIQEELNNISGVESEGYQNSLDKKYKIYECHTDYYIKDDPLAPNFEISMPYIVSIDAESGKTLSIYRNSKQDDIAQKKREFFVNYSFLPSLDGEGYGMLNYAGKLAEAATQITRQLINAGTYANFPGGIYASGIRLENNNIRAKPGEFIGLQTGGIPIDQVIRPFPYKEPSQALKEILVSIEDSIKRPSAIVNQKVSDMTSNAAMGTVLAMLESLQKIPNAILQGFHESFGQELMLFNDRFAEWLPEGESYPFLVPGGEHVIMKKDFADHIVVIPASDPSLQNSSYRFMQSEIVLNQARQSPELHDMHAVYDYFYTNLGVSPEKVDKFLIKPPSNEPPPPPFSGDPITEDQYLLVGKPIMASVWQEHDAHIMVHKLILNNPEATDQAKAAAGAHIQEHEAFKLLVEMQQQIGFEMPQDPTQIPPEMQNQIAVQAAQVAQQKLEQMQGMQANQPAPMDPAYVMDEDSKRKAEIAHEQIALDKLKLSVEQAKIESSLEIEQMKLQQKDNMDAIKYELENKKIELDQISKDRDRLLKELQTLKQHNEDLYKGVNNYE
jgi:hypothetical protein